MIFYRTLESSPVHSCYSSSQRMKSSVFFGLDSNKGLSCSSPKVWMEFPSLSHLSEPNTVDWEIIDSREHWEIAFNLDLFLFSRFSMFPSDIWQKTHFPQRHWDFFVKLCKKTDYPILIKWWWDVDGNFVSCNKKIIKAFLCFSCRDVRVMGLPQWSSLCNDRSQCQFFSS